MICPHHVLNLIKKGKKLYYYYFMLVTLMTLEWDDNSQRKGKEKKPILILFDGSDINNARTRW